MAQKRMFNKTITNSDKFLELPLSTQALYFHLNMNADDDGFIDNAKTIKRMIGANDLDLKMLVEQNFLILFDTGIIVVKDWRIHNTIRNDRYNKTVYVEEFKQLQIAETKEYQGFEGAGNLLATKWHPSGTHLATQKRIEEDRRDKNRIEEDRRENSLVIISEIYQSKIGVIDGDQFNQLADFVRLDGMVVEVIIRAITEAADNNKRNFKYILVILRNWKQNGITTIAQVEERERERLNARVSRQNTQPRQTNIPDWSNNPIRTEQTAEGQAELQALYAELEELENG
ncbi:DnaD domain-containing protein [Streptococcus sp. ZJ93]|uniref:DnaD domain-containing protein n=1 Tax=Streptococcus handemini TaxID=3161188 RepID=UPI0032EB1308